MKERFRREIFGPSDLKAIVNFKSQEINVKLHMLIKILELDEANRAIDIKVKIEDHQNEELRKIRLCHSKISC